jgi:hypothetical protein
MSNVSAAFDESSPSNRIGENRCLKKSTLIAAASSVTTMQLPSNHVGVFTFDLAADGRE